MMNNRAFTLIELVVVLGIISIVTGLIFASYNYFSSKKELEADVKKLVSILELAREKARGRDRSICNDVDDEVLNYRVEITKDKYSLTAECQNSSAKSIDYTLKKNNFLQNGVITFEINTGNNKSGCMCFQIKNKFSSLTSDYICINDYGTIETKKNPTCN